MHVSRCWPGKERRPGAIAKELGVSDNMVSRWRGRLARDGICQQDVRKALADEPRSGRPSTIAPATRLQVIATACDPLPDATGLSGWRLDLLVEELAIRGISEISRSSVHRILSEADVQPHRQQMWLHSPDPEFVEKVNEIYRNGQFIVIAQPGPPDDPEDDDPVMRLTPIGASQFGASFCAPAGNWEKLPVSGTLQDVLVEATRILGPWLDADPIIDAT